jgi:hypothetical protein
MQLGTVHYSSLTTSFVGDDTQDSRYYGELYVRPLVNRPDLSPANNILHPWQVSRFLNSFLAAGFYDIDVHWTSPMRSRYGRGPFVPENGRSHATFTIPEENGQLTKSVIQGCGIDDTWISDSCTFHIEVCATNGGLYSPFKLSRTQREKVRLHPF